MSYVGRKSQAPATTIEGIALVFITVALCFRPAHLVLTCQHTLERSETELRDCRFRAQFAA